MNNLFEREYDGNLRINAARDRYCEPSPDRNAYGGLSFRHDFGSATRSSADGIAAVATASPACWSASQLLLSTSTAPALTAFRLSLAASALWNESIAAAKASRGKIPLSSSSAARAAVAR